MTKLPEWRRDGWRPNGPGLCICPHCGARVSTNALGRNSHLKACPTLKRQEQAREAQRASSAGTRSKATACGSASAANTTTSKVSPSRPPPRAPGLAVTDGWQT